MKGNNGSRGTQEAGLSHGKHDQEAVAAGVARARPREAFTGREKTG